MPWGKRKSGNKVCVYKKDTGETLHCYEGSSADARADKYIAALYANSSHKELEEISTGLYMTKEDDGRYIITTVSTAALKDQDDETFSVEAIDWDIKEAEAHDDYPEYRMFHKKWLVIGKVEKMYRVGIFAVDQGHSYTDPFSISVCKNILAKNNGKWRCSRGFYVHEASGNCPQCDENLVITKEHMIAGFRCPVCKAVHMSYKGVLKDLHFRKARTFDVTITDIPCMSYTGVSAIKSVNNLEAKEMLTKAQLKQKLLDAGVSEDVIEIKLSAVTDAQLKELGDDIPEATLLKEMDLEEADDEEEDEQPEEEKEETSDEEQTFVLDPSVLKEFVKLVKAEITEQLSGLEIDVETPIEKEVAAFAEFKEQIAGLTSQVEKLIDILGKTDKERLKEVLDDTPRAGKLRVMRFKQDKKHPMMDEEDMEDEDDEDEDVEEKEVRIVGGDGTVAKSMTEFVTAKH